MNVLITGIQGQDGSQLAAIHHKLGDQVWGTVSSLDRNLEPNMANLITERLEDPLLCAKILNRVKPYKIYHLAARHNSATNSSPISLKSKKEMFDCHVGITRNILDWQVANPESKSLIALSSQMYTPVDRETRISEDTKCSPRNFYAETKYQAMLLLQNYRVNFQTNTFGAILFNHTSIRSKSDFLFPYLAKQIVKVVNNVTTKISLQDSNSLIDICHADEVCDGMYKILNTEIPCEVIFSSGRLVPISDIVTKTFNLMNFRGKVTLESEAKDSLDQKFVYGDTTRLSRIINWNAILKPEEILLQLVLKELV